MLKKTMDIDHDIINPFTMYGVRFKQAHHFARNTVETFFEFFN